MNTIEITAETNTHHTVSTHQLSVGWLLTWALITAAVAFEVVKHGFVDGSALDATLLVTAAVGFFIAPDLTFLVGIGDTVEHGQLSTRAVPWYNAMHRMWVPVLFTTVVGIALAPLALAPLAIVPLAAFIGGLSWMAHIAMDRAAGYGLRNADGSR